MGQCLNQTIAVWEFLKALIHADWSKRARCRFCLVQALPSPMLLRLQTEGMLLFLALMDLLLRWAARDAVVGLEGSLQVRGWSGEFGNIRPHIGKVYE
jgi:hypothetical protein